MNDLEGLWTLLRREFSTELVAKVRKATVTAAASTTSYSILLPGEVNDRDGVPSVSPVVPQVGDIVRVELVADEPCIVGVYNAGPSRVQATVATQGTTTSTTYVSNLTTGGAGPTTPSINLVAGQTVAVTVTSHCSTSPSGGFGAVMAWAVSGVETLAADDNDATEQNNNPGQTLTKTGLYTATVTGSHIFGARYKVINATTGTFNDRRIIVAK